MTFDLCVAVFLILVDSRHDFMFCKTTQTKHSLWHTYFTNVKYKPHKGLGTFAIHLHHAEKRIIL